MHASVYMTAVLEGVCLEIFQAAIKQLEHDRKTLRPDHVHRAILEDNELKEVFRTVTFPSGGVLPNNINKALQAPKTKKGKTAKGTKRKKTKRKTERG